MDASEFIKLASTFGNLALGGIDWAAAQSQSHIERSQFAAMRGVAEMILEHESALRASIEANKTVWGITKLTVRALIQGFHATSIAHTLRTHGNQIMAINCYGCPGDFAQAIAEYGANYKLLADQITLDEATLQKFIGWEHSIADRVNNILARFAAVHNFPVARAASGQPPSPQSEQAFRMYNTILTILGFTVAIIGFIICAYQLSKL